MFKCKKCKKTFKSKKYLDKHSVNKVPCNFVCRLCGLKLGCRRSWYNHIKNKHTQNNNVQQINNINNSKNNIDQSSTQKNVNNMVFLAPYGLEHKMMEKEKTYREQVLGSTRDKVLDVLRKHELVEAYQILFEHLHGNQNRPEHHNIFIQDRDRDEVCMFNGRQFSYRRADKEIPGLYRYLMVELKWMVGTADIKFEEKDQLLHDIKCHWRLVNEEKDEDIRRMLYNNKPIVETTIHNNIVKPNTDMIEDYYDFKRGTLKTFDIEIGLPT